MWVLDASALLAYLKAEPGQEVVKAAMSDAAISSVNWAEVVQKAILVNVNVEAMRLRFMEVGLTIESFTLEDAENAGRLWTQTREYGLSLGDRACLSLGLRLNATVLTSDRAWKSIQSILDIQIIR